jgi:PDZ domain/Aspartyl protease
VPTDTTITGIAGVVKVPFVFNQTLHLPGLDVEKLNFHVVDYSVLTSVYGEHIDGVIGYSFFSRYIVQINFDSSDVSVYQPGKFTYPRGGALLHPIFTAMPIQWLYLKDARKLGFNFYMDTGAGLCLLLSEQFVKDSSILLSRRRPLVTQVEGVGGKQQMRLTVVKRLRVGPYSFYNVPTYLYADSFNITSYPFVGGLIGNDLLRRFNQTFNYPAREVHLLPNSRFREPFDYAYTGLAIYFEDNEIKVEDVVPGSPADRAGFMPGDVLISVGNNFSNNIMTYKTILQNSDEKIKVIVRRDKTLVEISLKPASIL